MIKIDSQVMKNHNALMIIRMVQQNPMISRTDLTQRVGLTPASVINITNSLMESGILVQAGLTDGSAQGRRALLLNVNPKVAYVLGLHMDTEAVTVSVGDYSGDFVSAVKTPISSYEGCQSILDKMFAATEQSLRESGVDAGKVLGMGMSLPGPLDSQAGVMINPPNFPDWKNIPIRQIFEKRLGIPVCCDRETNAAALAECYLGAGVGYQTVFFLSLFQLGVGGALVSSGNVLHGFCDGAGEIGHSTVDPAGPLCTCGNYGCLEALVSGKALVEHAQRLYKMRVGARRVEIDIEHLQLEDVFRLSEAGDEVCLHVVTQAASYISVALGNVISFFSPEVIILGGELPAMSPQLVQLIRDRVCQRVYPRHCSDVHVTTARFGSAVFTKGAIVQALNAFAPNLLAKEL